MAVPEQRAHGCTAEDVPHRHREQVPQKEVPPRQGGEIDAGLSRQCRIGWDGFGEQPCRYVVQVGDAVFNEFVEQVCRIYVTHPGVDAQGIIDKMEVSALFDR